MIVQHRLADLTPHVPGADSSARHVRGDIFRQAADPPGEFSSELRGGRPTCYLLDRLAGVGLSRDDIRAAGQQ